MPRFAKIAKISRLSFLDRWLPGYWNKLAVVGLLRGRNLWVKIAVLRNNRREVGYEQRNARFLVRNIFRRRGKNVMRAFFSPEANIVCGAPVFSIALRVGKTKVLGLFSDSSYSKNTFRYSPQAFTIFEVPPSAYSRRKRLDGLLSVFGIRRDFCSGTFQYSLYAT